MAPGCGLLFVILSAYFNIRKKQKNNTLILHLSVIINLKIKNVKKGGFKK